MAKVNALVNSFTSGEVTPRLNARVDTTKYRTGLRTCLNFIVMPHGGVRKRGGSKFIAPCKSGATATKMIPFEFNTEQTYMLEFGYAPSAGYIRFFTNGGILTESAKTITGATQANPCVITANSHGFSSGDWVLVAGVGGMTRLNNRHLQVGNTTADTFELVGIDATGYAAYTSGGSVSKIFEVETSFTSDEIDDISYAQSADTLYLAHENHPLQKLERFNALNWMVSNVDVRSGPFRRINGDQDNTIAVAVASLTGNISGATQANPCVITTSAVHDLSDGATVTIASVSGMTELNGNKYEVRVLSATSFYLCDARGVPVNGTGYTAYTSGGTFTQATTRWSTISPGTTVTLTAFKDTFQSGHVGALWRLWEPGRGTGVSQPYGTNTITNTSQYTKDSKVYGIINLTGTTTWQNDFNIPTHDTGFVRVQNDDASDYYDAVYLHDSTAVLEIISVASARIATARVLNNHIAQSIVSLKTSFWEEGAWSEVRGYPSLLTFHEQRLWACGSLSEPQTIWASTAGIFETFQDGADDDRALVYKIASDRVETPSWLLPGKVMTMGTASGEFSIGSNNQQEAMTPSNVRIVRQTTWGSAQSARALRIGNAVLFVQRDGRSTNGGRRVREFGYQFESDSFSASDLTIVSEHLGNSRLMDLVYQQDPEPVVWVRREDGTFIGLTYEKVQEVLGWHRHALGGTDAEIVDFGAIPGDSGDEFWITVERTIDETTKRYIEVLTNQNIGTTAKEDFTFLDCHLTYDGTATDTVTGLNHLEGETVSVLADGAVHPDVTVLGGSITLGREASVIHIGYGYTAVLETMDLEAGAQAGTAHGRPKRISECVTRFYRSLGGRIGISADKMEPILFRTSADAMGSSPPLSSGFKRSDFPAGWEDEAIVRLEHDQPLPCNVLSVTVEMNVTG